MTTLTDVAATVGMAFLLVIGLAVFGLAAVAVVQLVSIARWARRATAATILTRREEALYVELTSQGLSAEDAIQALVDTRPVRRSPC